MRLDTPASLCFATVGAVHYVRETAVVLGLMVDNTPVDGSRFQKAMPDALARSLEVEVASIVDWVGDHFQPQRCWQLRHAFVFEPMTISLRLAFL